MKNGHILIGILVIVVIAYALYWAFMPQDKITLASGGSVYKRMGKYYREVDNVSLPIDTTEYNQLKGTSQYTQDQLDQNCYNPNASTQKTAACDYYGYAGYINACGGCSLVRPASKTA